MLIFLWQSEPPGSLNAANGGVPKYLKMLASTPTTGELWPNLINEHSLLIEEGHYRLAEEFGPDNSRYFSILAAIASGRSSRPEIKSLLETSVATTLKS